MSNYEDWDPNWRPVGDPVPTDEGSEEYDWSDEDSGGESAPSEPTPSGMDIEDQQASEPSLGEAWAELRRQFEAAGVGAGGVASEPESPDEVVWGWRARLERPDKYGQEELGPDESGFDRSFPDESERAAQRPTYVGPARPGAQEYAVPLPSADWQVPQLSETTTPTGEPWKPLATEPSQVSQPAWLQGWADILARPGLDYLRNETRLLNEPIDKLRQGDYPGAAFSLATIPQRGLAEVALPLYGDYLKALGEPAKWVERDLEGSYLDVANAVAKNPDGYQPITDPNRDYALQPWSPTSNELPPGRDKIVLALAALSDQERQEAIDQLKSMAYSPQENQLKALEQAKTKGWQKAIEDDADPWAETLWQGILDPTWLVPAKWADVLFKPANLPLELLSGAAKAGARGLAERIPWAKTAEFGKEALQSGGRAAGRFYDELKPRLVEVRERVARAVEQEISVPAAIRQEIAGKLRGFEIRTPGELLNTLLGGPKGQPRIWDYLPTQAIPDEGVSLLRDVSQQLKGLSQPTRESVTQVFDDARARASQLVGEAKQAVARMAQRQESQAATEMAARAGREPNLWDTANRKREELGRGLSAAKEEFLRRVETQFPPANRELVPEGFPRGWNAEKDAGIVAARAGKPPAGKGAVGPKMPGKGEQPVGPKMPTKGEPAVGPKMPGKGKPPAGPVGEGKGQLPGGAGGEPPGKPPVGATAPAGGEDESLRRIEALHPSRNKDGLRKTFLIEFEKEANKPFYPTVNAGENVEVALAAEAEELGKFGAIFASPNRGNLTLEQSISNLDSSAEKWFEKGAGSIAEVLLPDAATHRVLGVWSDGAENSVAIIVGEAVDEATLDYVGARLGRARDQKQVLRFRAHSDGTHAMYVFDVPSRDLKELSNDALALGIPHESFVPMDSGTRVLVFDKERELGNNVLAFGGAHGATNQQTWTGTGRQLGDLAGLSREIAELEYARTIGAYEKTRLGDKPWRVFSHSARAGSAKGQPGREAGLGSPFAIPTSTELSDWPRELKARYAAWLRGDLGDRGISIPDETGLLLFGPTIGDFQSLVAAAVARAAARARRAGTSDEVTSPQSDSRGGSSGFGGAHGATNQQIWSGTGRWLGDPAGLSREIAELDYRRDIQAFEGRRLGDKPWRIFSHSTRTGSAKAQAGRGAGVASPFPIPTSTGLSDWPRARAQAYSQWADGLLAHLNATLDDWQAQALAKLARPVGPALPLAFPRATANRWAQMLSHELRQAVGESALAVNRRHSGNATKPGVIANVVGAAIRPGRAPYDKQPTTNLPRPVRSLTSRPAVPVSTLAVSLPKVDARSMQVRQPKQSPRPALSISQQMARLYRGTVAGDDYWSQTRAREPEAWAWVPDDLKRALEAYWQGRPLTRGQVQRLMPVYRQYVAKTGYPGDMAEWVTATLKNERYPQARAGAA